MRFLATCFLTIGFALSAQTYTDDMKALRLDYAEHKSEIARRSYFALGPKKDFLVIHCLGGWSREDTDHLMETLREEWCRLGFQRVVFVQTNTARTPVVSTIKTTKITLPYSIYREEVL